MGLSRAGRRRPFLRSIRARYTCWVGALFLVVLSIVATLAVLGIRNSIVKDLEEGLRQDILGWVNQMAPGVYPPPQPQLRTDYMQLVDQEGRVVAANDAGSQVPPLTDVRPALGERLEDVVTCPEQSPCLMVAVLRFDGPVAQTLFGGEEHYIIAGEVLPPALTMPYMSIGFAAAALIASAAAAWVTWVVVGRMLCPVRKISDTMREATATDLSLRVPTPPGDDEIARFARTSNLYLDRLEKAVTAQRRFASLVSHELRAPVAGLHVQLEEALMYPDEVDSRSALRLTLRTTERLQAIIDDLLAYTKVKDAGPVAHQPIDLTALVEEELAAQPRTGTRIQLHRAGRPVVLGSRVQLSRVLDNLLANARRHAQSRIDVSIARRNGHAVLVVQDDGKGIAPGDRERVFQPFVRLAEGQRLDPGGSGLGLAVSRETCIAHGGTLTVEDCPSGARFVVRLPACDDLPAISPAIGPA
ncbi:HAMP domain-containing sensor histidine kinase [Nonomuraea sp. NPDC004580]|uniref:sensor histidine kinase n=1 Tax=Nonomuraea sp. NPDC004580 TaxID=3154552 RepID=UPI0033B51315